jgi:nucleoside-diphosphate-sugar epimerase
MTAPERRLLIFGLGYTSGWLAAALTADGWRVAGTSRSGRDGTLPFDDPLVLAWLRESPYILSSVPPTAAGDPVLMRWGAALTKARPHWLGYLSSTGVYGDTGGEWVDETSPTGRGRRAARSQADADWQAMGAHVFRLPGIYGPGRSPFDRLRDGTAQRIDKPGHVFGRIHVDDIVQTVRASMAAPVVGGRVYNVVDDEPVAPRVPVELAAELAGLPLPPLIPYEQAQLSPMAQGFYTESRRVRADRIKQELGIRLIYPTYREGLAAIAKGEQGL